MKTREQSAADELVEDLFDDLDGRAGFDTGGVADDDLAEWKAEWAARVVTMIEDLKKEDR